MGNLEAFLVLSNAADKLAKNRGPGSVPEGLKKALEHARRFKSLNISGTAADGLSR